MTKIHDSEYTGTNNFDIAKYSDELHVRLTYPPWSDTDNTKDQCRFVVVNQESVRASDGIRVWYDYGRDGFVIEQNAPEMKSTGPDSAEQVDHWKEVYFAKSWALEPPEFDQFLRG